MASGDIHQLTVTGSYLGQTVVNRWFYRQNSADIGGVGTEVELVQEFQTEVLEVLMNAMSDEYSISLIEGVGLRDPGTFNYTAPIAIDGDLTMLGAPSPAFLAIALRFQRVAPGQRYGYKRFPAPPGDFIDGNSTIPTYQSTYGDPLASAMSATLTPAGLSFSPFVASRPILFGANPSGYVSSFVSYRGLTTQNTRKP